MLRDEVLTRASRPHGEGTAGKMPALPGQIDAALRELEARRGASNENAMRVAGEMIAGVRARGDAFVREQVERFDGVTVDDILIAPREVSIDPAIRDAVELAIERIEAFHRPQLPQSYRWNGIEHRVRPLRRVGVYVPGGRAVYLSTLIMCAVPARIAGVRELVVITTPSAASRDELHYACSRLGISAIYQCGGATGIAAAALGTESLQRVDKIVGPGNQYVTAAKAQLVGTVGIDMTAGPTELVVIADESSNVEFVQADLDAQAEHGPDSAVICISIGCSLDVRATLNFSVASVDDAIALADRIAPEHVSIHARGAAGLAERLENCGAIFCGPFSPVAAGDYVAGPNHVLPTGGSARFFSPLGVYDFVKRSNIIELTAEELAEISEAGERIAAFEGLPKHAASIAVRRTYVA
ncbi:MAG TPA: histidinol dehydrogenase [Thermoanaerobaculia bacterium]|jgi:histidinol dehydrogenase|nr:histidinol dehydrogenase [Thermoanaerobaculia bacterium]